MKEKIRRKKVHDIDSKWKRKNLGKGNESAGVSAFGAVPAEPGGGRAERSDCGKGSVRDHEARAGRYSGNIDLYGRRVQIIGNSAIYG